MYLDTEYISYMSVLCLGWKPNIWRVTQSNLQTMIPEAQHHQSMQDLEQARLLQEEDDAPMDVEDDFVRLEQERCDAGAARELQEETDKWEKTNPIAGSISIKAKSKAKPPPPDTPKKVPPVVPSAAPSPHPLPLTPSKVAPPAAPLTTATLWNLKPP